MISRTSAKPPFGTQYAVRLLNIRSILIAFLVLGATYSIVTPIFEASDELWHYPLVQWLSKGNPLPVQDAKNVGLWKQEASQPPLYYWLMGWATFWINTSDMAQVRQENPHVNNGVITPDGNRNLVVHNPERESFPWQGTVLAVHLVRLLSVLMGAVTVWLTYRIALELFPDRSWLALGAAAVNAFTPMFIFIGGAVNNDNLTMLLCSLGLLLIVKRVREYEGAGIRDQKATERELPLAQDFFYRLGRWLPLGIVLGLGALTKTSALALIPITGIAVILVAWRKGSWREFWAGALATALPVMLIAGWWYVRNVSLYGDVTGINAFIDVLGKRAAPASLLQLWGERWGFMLSYWGLFGGVNVPIDYWGYHVLNGLAILAVIGVAVYFVTLTWRWFREDPIHNWRDLAYELRDYVQGRAALFLVGLFGVIVVALLTQWARVTWSSQGRLVFSAISTWSIYLVLGLATIATRRFAKPFMALVGVFMFIISALAPFTTIAPAYARNAPTNAAPQIPVEVTFGDQIKLLGADVTSLSASPGGQSEITLYWQALKPIDKDYSTFVHLLGGADILVAGRDMYPGQGLWPTSQMRPGDVIASRYVLNILVTEYAPDRLTWEVGVYDYFDPVQKRLPASSGGDNVRFGAVELQGQAGAVPNPMQVNLSDQIELIGYSLDRRAASPGETIFLTLYWRARSKMPADYTVFTHVLQPPETKWAQHDKPLQPPSSSWSIGQVVSDTYELKLSPDTPLGVYEIEVGVYNPNKNFERLRVFTEDGRIIEDYVLLGKVRAK
ncbi:MAG TPA: glycosyltransferase family 39 protein [Anaerolineae bacterium]|nr:glycosyltransferase family 39 protein [Anaerolineae bacterium]